MNERVPQNVQNLVIRDFCNKKGLQYLLSATEYAFENSYLILNQVLDELNKLEGIVFYSLFLLPEKKLERDKITQLVLDNNKTIFFALEGLKMSNEKERKIIESIWQVRKTLPYCIQKT